MVVNKHKSEYDAAGSKATNFIRKINKSISQQTLNYYYRPTYNNLSAISKYKKFFIINKYKTCINSVRNTKKLQKSVGDVILHKHTSY